MKEKGVPIDFIDPNPEVRKNAELAPDWPFREQAQYLYGRAVLFRERLIDPIARIDRNQMPDPVISFDNLRNKRSLAAYRLTRNPQGLNYEIIINNQHYEEVDEKMKWKYGDWALNETFCHELIHEWQQTVGKEPVQLGKVYHNKEFVDKCESVGLHPKLGEGYHIKLADGPFEILMHELGVEKPAGMEIVLPEIDIDWFKWFFKEQERKGRSTLKKWTCGCQNIRVGTKEFHGQCTKPECGNVFIVADGKTHNIYESSKESK
jgi:hypothetical protein